LEPDAPDKLLAPVGIDTVRQDRRRDGAGVAVRRGLLENPFQVLTRRRRWEVQSPHEDAVLQSIGFDQVDQLRLHLIIGHGYGSLKEQVSKSRIGRSERAMHPAVPVA